jgi:hypothetical protein
MELNKNNQEEKIVDVFLNNRDCPYDDMTQENYDKLKNVFSFIKYNNLSFEVFYKSASTLPTDIDEFFPAIMRLLSLCKLNWKVELNFDSIKNQFKSALNSNIIKEYKDELSKFEPKIKRMSDEINFYYEILENRVLTIPLPAFVLGQTFRQLFIVKNKDLADIYTDDLQVRYLIILKFFILLG